MTRDDEVYIHKHVREMLNSSEKTLSDYSEIIHGVSEQNISDDEDAIAETSEIVNDDEDAILELTEIISEMDARIKALEGGK